ncbi:paraneoplastic antigen Ma6F-like [Nannospalax galili]|uniref:paraneoplastic antigen Ma6F-like n=1 Tax=Nannospalax galili TaxID=1026970 RepID=UPI00111C15B1|nr:paraneoplastic antigen Ma6F-like [Nannospalax galili]
MAILQDWCGWMGVNAQRSVLILGIPDDSEEEEFQQAVRGAFRHLGRYRVLGKVFRKEIGAKVALIEFADNLSQRLIPQQIQNNREPWTVAFLPQVPDAEFEGRFSFPAQVHEQAFAGAAAGAGAEAEGVDEPGAPGEEGAVGEEGGSSEDEGAAGEEEMGEEGAAGEARGSDGEVEDEEGATEEEGETKGGETEEGEMEEGVLDEEEAGGEAGVSDEDIDEEVVLDAQAIEEAKMSDEEGSGGDVGIVGVLGAVGWAGAAGEGGVLEAGGGDEGSAGDERSGSGERYAGVEGSVDGAGAAGQGEGVGDARMSDEGAAGDMGVAGVRGAVGLAGGSGEEGDFDTAGGAHGAGAWTQQWSQDLQSILDNMAYQELRPFSGLEEPGCGGEAFESWLTHANDMLYLWRHIPERERRRRLMESLGGPALDILYGFLEEHPDTPAQECLAALAQAFRGQDMVMAARLKFMTCCQQPQETLFDYMMRLEGLLQVAVEKGGIQPAMVEQLWDQKVLMQAQPNQMLHNNPRKMEMQRGAPGFLEQLSLLQETEAWEAALTENVQVQMQEGVEVCGGGGGGELNVAQGALVSAEGVDPACAGGEASPASEAPGRAAAVSELATEADPDGDRTIKAGPGSSEAKVSTDTQEDENISSAAGPVGPETLVHSGEQEVEEPIPEGLKEESGNEAGAWEASYPKSFLGK